MKLLCILRKSEATLKVLLKFLHEKNNYFIIGLLFQFTLVSPVYAITYKEIKVKAEKLMQAGDQPGAIKTYESYLKVGKRNIDLRKKLMTLYNWNSRPKDALKMMEDLHRISPRNKIFAEQLGKAYMGNAKLKEATIIYEKLEILKKGDFKVLETLYKLYNWTSRSSVAVKVLQEMYRMKPDDEKIAKDLSNQLIWGGKGPVAVPILERLIKKNGRKVEYSKKLLPIYNTIGKKEAALKEGYYIVEKDKKDIKTRYLLAQICHWDLCWPKSIQFYEEILVLDPKHKGANKYLPLLRKDKKQNIKLIYTSLSDTTGFDKSEGGISYLRPVSGNTYLGMEFKQSQFSSKTETDASRENNLKAVMKYYLIPSAFLTLKGGGSTFSITDTWIPYYLGRLNWNMFKFIYPQFTVERSPYVTSIVSVKSKIKYTSFNFSVYSEPASFLVLSGAYEKKVFSDSNKSRTWIISAKYIPFQKEKPYYLSLNFYASHEKYERIYTDSNPYFTFNGEPGYSPSIDLGYTFFEIITLMAGYGVTRRKNESSASNPKVGIEGNFTSNNKLKLDYTDAGSESYGFKLLEMSYNYSF